MPSPLGYFADAPIKRMSILERRPGDSRRVFLRHWHQVHGKMVAEMPYLHSYNQNHVVEEFDCGKRHFPADGFVEQLWRTPREMQMGYNSSAVQAMIADELNYLGHGSNYAILAAQALRHVPDGSKLICTLRHNGSVSWADEIFSSAAAIFGADSILREDVISTIAKPNMLPTPPRPVDAFLHIHTVSPQACRQQGRSFARRLCEMQSETSGQAGLHRIKTFVIVYDGKAFVG